MERAFEHDYEFVYHLAAEFGRINGEEYYDTLWTTNVIGTRNILEIQKRRKFKLIFASSSEIYGDKHQHILSEDIPLNHSIIQHNDYAVTKWVNEIQIMNFEKRHGSPVVRLRLRRSGRLRGSRRDLGVPARREHGRVRRDVRMGRPDDRILVLESPPSHG